MSTTRLKDRHVLIVDDDEDILASMDLAVRAEGATTRTVTDGNAAVSASHDAGFDAVVLDMMLPKRSGFLVLEKLVQEQHPPVVVMVTANQGRRHMAYAQALGVHAYMTKPVPLERLVDTLADLLQDRPARERPQRPGRSSPAAPPADEAAGDDDEPDDSD